MNRPEVRDDKLFELERAFERLPVRDCGPFGLAVNLPGDAGEFIMKPGSVDGTILSFAYGAKAARLGPVRLARFSRRRYRGRFFNPMEADRIARFDGVPDSADARRAILKLALAAWRQRDTFGYDVPTLKNYITGFATKVMDLNESEVDILLASQQRAESAFRPALVTPYGKIEWAPKSKIA